MSPCECDDMTGAQPSRLLVSRFALIASETHALQSKALRFRSFRRVFGLPVLILTLIAQFVSPAYSRKDFSPRDQLFLQELEQRSFQYFWEQAGAPTGLVLDRTRRDGTPADEDHRTVASIAATGFGLTALCIAAERGWVNREQARERVRNTLRFFADRAPQEHGWFYHWMDTNSGERRWNSEVSSIDTALLLAGMLTARQYFRDDKKIVGLATRIYERIDFPWMLNGHPTLLSMGWRPETGFIKSRWDDYS